ncbi:MAG: flagellar filament capping protein FliD [Planctomycetaceae bacterium]|nr:flagellar filament capping protein FliD [Planctomycetaceae bacterium]
MLSINGLVSGIDTETIVSGLLEIQQKQIDLLQSRSERVAVQQGAFQGLQAQLQSLRSDAGRLTSSLNSVFDARQVTVSDENAVLATASDKAAAGVYQIRVNELARAHQVASQGFADTDAAITQGTITFQVGDASPVTLTIDSSNDTLGGLATAINNSGAGISATIVQDGSGGGTPYRLLLTAEQTGASQAISITNNLAATGGGATQPDFDTDNPVQAAADASVTLGSGPGAITVFSQTNTVESLISGVSLTLRQADVGQEVTVSVTADTEPAVEAVQDFVDSFNKLVKFVDSLSQFDSASGTGGILLGNRNVTSILNSVRSTLLEVVPGLEGKTNRLSAIGVSVTDKGELEFKESQLTAILNGQKPGINSSDLKRLFALDAGSSHGSIQFISGSSRTQASTTPYQVDITQAAEKASITATNSLAAEPITIDGTNNTFRVTVDGADSGELTLNAGDYTAQELADHIESIINSASTLAGRNVSVNIEGGKLTLTSNTYGSRSAVTIGSGTANSTLGFAGGETDIGKDVAGTFIVDGQTESATGRGQLLIGESDNEHTADLQLRISLTAADVVSGPEADITVTRGVAARLDQVLNDFLDPVTGRLKTINDGFDETINSIQFSIDRQTAVFELQRESIVQQFVALESAISELNTTSSFLTSQLAGLKSR